MPLTEQEQKELNDLKQKYDRIPIPNRQCEKALEIKARINFLCKKLISGLRMNVNIVAEQGIKKAAENGEKTRQKTKSRSESNSKGQSATKDGLFSSFSPPPPPLATNTASPPSPPPSPPPPSPSPSPPPQGFANYCRNFLAYDLDNDTIQLIYNSYLDKVSNRVQYTRQAAQPSLALNNILGRFGEIDCHQIQSLNDRSQENTRTQILNLIWPDRQQMANAYVFNERIELVRNRDNIMLMYITKSKLPLYLILRIRGRNCFETSD